MEGSERNLLIYNPRAGRNGARPPLERIVSALGDSADDYRIRVTEYQGHARELARDFGGAADTVICCGGDGTLNEVVAGLLQGGHRPKVGYVPIGSTNDYASNLGIPKKMEDAMALIASGRTNECDIGSFNGRNFNYIASFGPGTTVSYATSQKLKNHIGYSAYMINGFVLRTIPTMRELKPKHIRIEYDGNVLDDEFYFCTVTNALSAAGLFRYDENTVKFNDGQFEIMLVRRLKSPLSLFSMLNRMRTRDYDGETLMCLRGSDIRFWFDTPEPWTLDGEYGGTYAVSRAVNRSRSLNVVFGK